ncbi:MAG: hypothetical protein DBX52_01945 [Clostridiales bacterium]|nr:MAG: hypothetical protein DBX52_01945 [Clostridiales bacterium]
MIRGPRRFSADIIWFYPLLCKGSAVIFLYPIFPDNASFAKYLRPRKASPTFRGRTPFRQVFGLKVAFCRDFKKSCEIFME